MRKSLPKRLLALILIITMVTTTAEWSQIAIMTRKIYASEKTENTKIECKEVIQREKTKTSTTIVECAILIAMAFALSFIKIIDMPYGGSVTAASMVPIIVAGYRHGLKWGLLTGFTYSILQLLMGLANV